MTITDSQFDTLAQSAHFFAGLSVVFASQILFGHWSWGALGLTAFAAVKEFWLDNVLEDAEVRGSDLKDFLFYMLGGALAIISILVKTNL